MSDQDISIPVVQDVGDIAEGFDNVGRFMAIAKAERSQLYGAVIALMVESGIHSIDLGSPKELRDLCHNHHAAFIVGDNANTLRVVLNSHSAIEG